MCGIWKKKNKNEMEFGKIKLFLRNNANYLKEVNTVGLVGGEPFLHKDYVGIIKLLVDYLPNLKSIGTPTNGILYEKIIKKIKESLKIISKKVFFGVSLSIDGIGSKHEKIRNVPGIFEKNTSFLDLAKREFEDFDNFYITLTSTISKQNMDQMDDLNRFAKENRLRITQRPAMEIDSDYIDNLRDGGEWTFNEENKKTLRLKYFELFKQTHLDYYKMVYEMLDGMKRKLCCPFQNEGLIINPDWKVYLCLFSNNGYLGDLSKTEFDLMFLSKGIDISFIRSNLIKESCSRCYAECFTSRSSNLVKNGDLNPFFNEIIRGNFESAKMKLTSNLGHSNDLFFSNLLDFLWFGRTPGSNVTFDLDKILFKLINRNSKKFPEVCLKRNGVQVFSTGKTDLPFLQHLFLTVGRYYYVVKNYKESMYYLEMLKNNFNLENDINSEIENLIKRMQLKIQSKKMGEIHGA